MTNKPFLHSLLLAIFPVLFIWGNNLNEFRFSDVAFALILSAFLTTLIGWLLSRVIGHPIKATLILSGFILFFYSYGHLYEFLKLSPLTGDLPIRHRYLLPLGLIILIAYIIFVYRQRKVSPDVTFIANTFSIILVVMPAISIIRFTIVQPLFNPNPIETSSNSLITPVSNIQSQELPDLYYIIVDGYGRADILDQIYGIDNSDFIIFLESNDFYIAEQARSNYITTVLSLGSSLNMQYLDEFASQQTTALNDVRPYSQIIRQSLVRRIVGEYGYEMIAIQSGWAQTNIQDADYFLVAPENVDQPTITMILSRFNSTLVETTLLRAFIDLYESSQVSPASPFETPYRSHRNTVLFAFEALRQIPHMDGNYFVFSHIVSPHPPFVFDRLGNEIEHTRAFNLADVGDYYGSPETYIEGYRDQLLFINHLLERTLTEILQNSEPAPIIILQADHGPGAYMNWYDPEAANLLERSSILNAYYLQGNSPEGLYPSITPVNSFRWLLSIYFGMDLPLVEDRSYYNTIDDLYHFQDITQEVNP